MAARVRAVCIHGHYYQPPREHPWLGVVEPEPSAAPDHDWNARILRECYAPNAAARLLDASGRLRGVVDNYAWTSFDVGPTLDAWLGRHAPELIEQIVAADGASRRRTGRGGAWAQAYNHPILPLCTPRDVRTQVRWGARAFALRFGRPPDGMWLPEMAVDVAALEALAAEGVTMTMLSPHQARRVRPLGGGSWEDVTPTTIDVRRVYAYRLPSGRSLDVVFRHEEGSRGLAFGEWLRDGGLLADRVLECLRDADGDAMLTLATDGETFGHHHRFGEMAVAYAIERLRREGVTPTNPAAFRAATPPTHEVEVVERSSWSCAHGVARWREGCACRVGGPPEWTTAWRGPLRVAIDWLRDELARVFETEGARALRDPWGARDRWIDAVVDPERAVAVVTSELVRGASARDVVQARTALEMARHALLMQTSCGWFFDDVAGVEATIVLRQAGRAIDLARRLAPLDLEGGFVDRLREAVSNDPAEGTAADVYRRAVQQRPVTAGRIAATAVVLDRLGEAPTLPGYDVVLGERADGEVVAVVEEAATGARDDVRVRATPHGASPACEVDGRRYGVADLFLVQRARLLEKVAADAMRAVRETRREALGRLRAVVDPLLGRQPALPLDLSMLLGFQETDRVLGQLDAPSTSLEALAVEVATVRGRGVTLAVQRLTAPLTARLVATLTRLPDGVEEALRLLALAEVAGAVLDLAQAQTTVARWWQSARPESPTEELLRLRDRLGLSPELGATAD